MAANPSHRVSKASQAGARKSPRGPRTTSQFEAFVAVTLAAEELQREIVELLKSSDLSLAQFNVLRVLRGAGQAGLTCGQVGGRLIRHDPDVTRLMDRLERRGLIERSREPRDRRVVRTRITPKGMELVGDLDGPVDTLHEAQFGHMNERRLSALKDLLSEVRARAARA